VAYGHFTQTRQRRDRNLDILDAQKIALPGQSDSVRNGDGMMLLSVEVSPDDLDTIESSKRSRD
jgi:hypothetical protein